jgi:hypothetical protein
VVFDVSEKCLQWTRLGNILGLGKWRYLLTIVFFPSSFEGYGKG